MSDILLANIINGIGVLILIIGHCVISWTTKKIIGTLLSGIGSALIVVGSYILESWPILLLNLLLVFISVLILIDEPKKIIKPKFAIYLLRSMIGTGCIFLALSEWDLAAYVTTAIYIFAYYCFVTKLIETYHYLIFTMLGFFFVLIHLVINFQYSLIVSELICFLISLFGLLIIYKKGELSVSARSYYKL